MKTPPDLPERRGNTRLALTACILVAVARPMKGDEAPVGLSESPILKHRVELQIGAPSRNESQIQWSGEVTIGNADRFFPKEGLTIPREEWATFADLTRAVLSTSELIRLVEPLADQTGKNGKEGKASTATRWVLLARFGLAAETRLVFFRLVDRASGSLAISADGRAATMEAALKAAMEKIDKEMLTYAWRCRVMDVRDDRVVIMRGRMDGLREGQKLAGYSLEEEGRKAPGEPDELTLMKYGKPAGAYQVVTAGEDYTELQPTQGSPMLSPGDVLVLPTVHLLREKDKATRGSSLWDRVFQK
jgi:hypothetical protein